MLRNVVKIVLVFTFVICISFTINAQSKTSLQWSTGGLGGGHYVLGSGIAELVREIYPEIDIKVVPGGGFANPTRVNTGESEIALTTTGKDKLAFEGKYPYETPHTNIRSIGASFGDIFIHVLVPKDSKINVLDDIWKNKMKVRIGVAPVGSGDEQALRDILAFYGYTFDDIKKWGGEVFFAGYADAVNLYKDRHIDLSYTHLSPSASAVIDMATSRPSKLIPLSEEVVRKLSEQYGFFPIESQNTFILKEKYPDLAEKDILTGGYGTQIIVNKDVDEEVVYKITKTLCENVDRLIQIIVSAKDFDPKLAWKFVTVPLHPGAERYYREMGYIK